MSKIKVEMELIFDNHEAWDTVDDFTNSFVKFLQAQNLKAEKILGEKDLNGFCLWVYPSVSNIPPKKFPTIKESLAALKPKK